MLDDDKIDATQRLKNLVKKRKIANVIIEAGSTKYRSNTSSNIGSIDRSHHSDDIND